MRLLVLISNWIQASFCAVASSLHLLYDFRIFISRSWFVCCNFSCCLDCSFSYLMFSIGYILWVWFAMDGVSEHRLPIFARLYQFWYSVCCIISSPFPTSFSLQSHIHENVYIYPLAPAFLGLAPLKLIIEFQQAVVDFIPNPIYICLLLFTSVRSIFTSINKHIVLWNSRNSHLFDIVISELNINMSVQFWPFHRIQKEKESIKRPRKRLIWGRDLFGKWVTIN